MRTPLAIARVSSAVVWPCCAPLRSCGLSLPCSLHRPSPPCASICRPLSSSSFPSPPLSARSATNKVRAAHRRLSLRQRGTRTDPALIGLSKTHLYGSGTCTYTERKQGSAMTHVAFTRILCHKLALAGFLEFQTQELSSVFISLADPSQPERIYLYYPGKNQT